MWDSEQLLRAVVAAGVLAVFISAIAYTYQPRLKLFVFSMPVPFVSGYLFTQIPVGTIHLIGIALTVVYHWIVYLLRRRLGAPLLVSIAVGIGAYIALAAMAQPLSDLPFKWAATGFVGLWAITAPLYRASHEPPHRSLAPIYIKTPTIFVIALAVYSMTRMLGGAVATFPFGGMFTSYEMRKSLFTLAGQYTINVISFGLMIIVMWLLQDRLTAPWPMILGVATLMATMLVIHAVGWGEPVVEGRP